MATHPLPAPLGRALVSAWRVYQAALEAGSPDRSARIEAARRRVAELAHAGHAAGWSWPSMAEPCGISWQRLQQIGATPPSRPPSAPIPKFPRHPRLEPKPRPKPKPKPKPKARGELTARERKTLRELAESAAKTRGSTPLGSRSRRDSVRFSELLYELHWGRDVPWADLAAATDRTVVALRRRVSRHGLSKTPPSVPVYRGVNIHDPDTPGTTR